jgi:hypothetical protein
VPVIRRRLRERARAGAAVRTRSRGRVIAPWTEAGARQGGRFSRRYGEVGGSGRCEHRAETIKLSSDELFRPEVQTIGPEVEISLSLVHLRGAFKKSYADSGANRPVHPLSFCASMRDVEIRDAHQRFARSRPRMEAWTSAAGVQEPLPRDRTAPRPGLPGFPSSPPLLYPVATARGAERGKPGVAQRQADAKVRPAPCRRTAPPPPAATHWGAERGKPGAAQRQADAPPAPRPAGVRHRAFRATCRGERIRPSVSSQAAFHARSAMISKR